MSDVDFEAWVFPDLVLTLGERTYRVSPPSVERAKMILAAAVRAEINLGIYPGPVPEAVERVLETIGDSHPGLGDAVYAQMVADEIPKVSIDRMAYYAVFYWARGAEAAGAIAKLLWAPRDVGSDGGDGSGPKG